MKQYRLRAKLRIKDDRQFLEKIITHNPATEQAFRAKCESDWVIIQGGENAPSITGRVVAFLPERVLRVMDDLGEIRITSVDQIVEDVQRRIYGKTNERT